MKTIIKLALLTAAISIITIDAKRLQPKVIPVTQNEKKMFIAAKNLQNAKTPQAKEKAAEKLANDLKKDPLTFLLLEREELTKDIKFLEEKIAKESGYISYFDTEEIQADKLKLTELQEDLTEVQNDINELKGIQPPAVSKFKERSFYAVIGIIGIGLLDQILTGGAGRTAILNKAGAIGEYFYPAVSTATNAATNPSEGSGSLLGAAGSFVASIAISEAKAAALQKIYSTIMSSLADPEIDPSTKEDLMQEAQETEAEFKALHKKISASKKLEAQITEQRNLNPVNK